MYGWVTDWLGNAKSLTVGLNNLRVIDLTLFCSSRLSLTIAEMSLLLEGLSKPSVKYKCWDVLVCDIVSSRNLKLLEVE